MASTTETDGDDEHAASTTTAAMSKNNEMRRDFYHPALSETSEHLEEEKLNNNEKERPYPWHVFFIIACEFCERFSFYGMKNILALYMTNWLSFSQRVSTMVTSAFQFSAYFLPFFGSILSDNYIGKFKTILYLSIIYVMGNLVMAITALPGITGAPPHCWGAILGLLLIAIGTGGIKPCVSPFGGDQFDSRDVLRISIFFSIFYFSINAGSTISMFITPMLRKIPCLGQDSCYPLAFGVPAIFMIIALTSFVLGSRLYKKESMRNNVVIRFVGLFSLSVCRIITRHKLSPSEAKANQLEGDHWLYNCIDKYDIPFIEDVRAILRVVLVGLPTIIFWALYDQQNTSWIFQAQMMSGAQNIFGWHFTLLPEQMGTINAVLVLILIFFCSHGVYVLFPMKPLTKMAIGMFLIVLSFAVAAFLQFVMVSRGTFIPNPEAPTTLICTAGCTNVLWQFPQYSVLTLAEVFLSVTGLEFSYSQAPNSLKSLCSAIWCLFVAFGDLTIIIVTLINPVGWFTQNNQMAFNFILYAVIGLLGSIAFVLLARGFVYKESVVDHIAKITIPPDDNDNDDTGQKTASLENSKSTDKLIG